MLAVSALMLSGCYESDTLLDTDGLSSKRINISSEIEQVNVTRVNDGGFVDGDAIGVYVADYDGDKPSVLQSAGNHADNVKFMFNGTSNAWESNATIYWTDNTTLVDAYGYYPFVSRIENVEAHPFSVSHHQETEATEENLGGYEASDFLWAKAEGVSPGNTIFLSHRHIMSSVQLSLIEGDGFDGDWAQLDKAVAVENTVNDCSIDLRRGVVTVADGVEPIPIIPMRHNNDYRCVVVPQTVAENTALIKITIDGETYNFARQEETTYQSGKLHKFGIKVDRRIKGDYEFTLVSEAVTAWENDPVSHDGESRSYITVNVPVAGGLKQAIDKAGLNYESIRNLKITGTINGDDFSFLKNIKILEAINLKEVKTVDCLVVTNNDEYAVSDDAIPNSAFGGMKLKYIVFPDRLKTIGWGAFAGVPLCQQLDFPEGLINIGGSAFANNNLLNPSAVNYKSTITKVNFPSTLQYIGENAFLETDMVQEVVLPNDLLDLGESAFYGCIGLAGTPHIPSSLSVISEWAFRGCKGLTGILEVPSNIQEVKGSAFCETGFSGLYLEEGLKIIRSHAFAGGLAFDYENDNYRNYLPTLQFGGELAIPNSTIIIEDGAFAFTGFKHIYIPDNFEELPFGLFMGCSELVDTLTVPYKVNNLQGRVFEGCSKLSAIVLPKNLLSIQDRCFAHCYNLNYIECKSEEPPALVGEGHFIGVAKDNFTLVVPKGCVEAYRNAPGWSEFKRISEYSGFVCRPQFGRLLNKSNEREIVLNADGAWTVTHQPSWAKVSATSGSQKTTLTVSIDALSRGGGNRVDSIVFSLTGTDHTAAYRIEQYDSEWDEDQCVTLQTATRGQGINLVFMGDGYDARDITEGTYLSDMRQSMEYFFDVEPYKTYRDYFNVYAPVAMSYESGIGTLNTLRNVKFETRMGTGCPFFIRMSSNTDKALYYAVDNTPVEESELTGLTVVLTPNTTEYDGFTYMYGDGSAVAVCPKSALAYPYDARGVVQHEAGGHGFGKLADEYIYHLAWIQTCKCVDDCSHVEELEGEHAIGTSLNMSLEGSMRKVPWAHLISDSRVNDIVDVYEGGYFHSRGVYRSEQNSCMNNNVPYYSTWCRQLIVERIKRLAGETFSYEDFMAHDSREWGRDFTLGTRGRSVGLPAAPRHGRAPVMIKRKPMRPKTK